jgi:hypothetical protein
MNIKNINIDLSSQNIPFSVQCLQFKIHTMEYMWFLSQDWLIDFCLTSSEPKFSYDKDENIQKIYINKWWRDWTTEGNMGAMNIRKNNNLSMLNSNVYSLFVPLSFLIWSLCSLSFALRLLITHLLSSRFSFLNTHYCLACLDYYSFLYS